MREMWKKSGLLYKIIAIMLTVIMVGTSLYFHFDRRYSAKAATIISMTRAYLPAGGNEFEYGTATGWQPIDEGTVGVGDGRNYAYILCFDQMAQDVGCHKSTNEQNEWNAPNNPFSYGGKQYYRFNVPANATYNIKFRYKETPEGEFIETEVIDAFTWTNAATKEMNASITRGDTVTNIAEGGSYYIKENDVLTVNVVTTSAPDQLTAYSVWGEAVDVSQFATANPDPQSLLYTYTFTKTFDDDNAVNTAMTTGNSISATVGGTPLTINCDYAYDATTPTITATLGNSTAYTGADKWYGSTVTPINSVSLAASSGDSALESNLAEFSVNSTNVLTGAVTSYTHAVNLYEGENVIVVSATDLAGNTTGDKTYTFKIDNTAPIINSVLTLRDLSTGNITISGSTSDKMADNVTNGSGVKKILVKIDKADDSAFCAEESFSVDTNGDFSLSLTDFPEIDADDLANGVYDGNGYKIYIKAEDKAGNLSDVRTDSFDIDATKPTITATLERHAADAAENEWETVPAADVDAASNTYYVNDVTYDKVRYKINVTELNLKTTNPVVIKKLNDEAVEGSVTVDGTHPNIFYYEISTGSNLLSKDVPLELKAIVSDKVGNVNADDNQILLPKLQLVDKDIRVELVEIWCDGEKLADVTNLSDIAGDFNKKYTIKVKAKSGFTMTDMELRRGDETYSAIPLADIGDDVNTVGIHTTNTVEFALPSSTDNDIFTNLKIYVKNDNNDYREVVIGDLLYDSTEPLVINTDAEVNYTKWYQEYLLSYEIVSGESVVESNLKSAKYSIDGQETVLAPTGVSQTGNVDIPESASTAGTKVVFEAEDNATNAISAANNTFVIKVDKTNPSVDALKVNGEEVTEGLVLAGAPAVSSTVTDNLTIDSYAMVVKYNDEDEVYSFLPIVLDNKEVTSEAVDYSLNQILGDKELKDGKYTISLSANDLSRRASNTATASFIVDNTDPVLGATIMGGMAAKNNGYYNTDVEVRLTCFDNNFDLGAMKVTDNGTPITADWKVGNDMFYADVRISSEGLHIIMVEGKDKAGNEGEAKQVLFIIDKTAPVVSLVTNGGQLYDESRGTLNLTGPLTLTASVSDLNEDAGDLKIQIIKTVPDTATITSEFVSTENRTFSFADEADYIVKIYAIDKANNQGPTRTISFRVDTTAPQITISGANGGVSASAASVAFNITEAFWSDAKGTVEIYRKAGDGSEEALYKTLTVTPNQRVYTLSELLNESGVYRIEFKADDRVGHTATTSQKITVDRNKPEITLKGVKNYDATDGEVSISAVINDEFYANKQVTVAGTRTDALGKKTALTFSPFAANANPTTINDTFAEDGIYDITVTAKDIAGNVSSNSVHFTIDTTDPVIGDLSKYDGKTFNEIDLDEIDLENLVTDLTVCEVRMYLNGSEYDGLAEIEDGSYTLLVTAKDELGHTSEKSVTFVVDTKAPVFIVTGVEDGEVRNDNYSIGVSLQLDEDTLDEVRLNDKTITLKDNEASVSVTEKGNYELYMKAYDEAGNVAEQTIKFTCGEENTAETISDAVEKAASHWWVWAIAIAGVFALGGAMLLVLKKRG